ncbi:hypothetical protein LguiA_008089 [Lonicera macranthoides]
MDVKELVLYLEEKLKQSVQLISVVKKDDKGGENKERKGDKNGDKKDKDNVRDKKEEESRSGDGKKVNIMEYYEYNPNTYTKPKFNQSEKKGKESGSDGGGGGGGGKKESKKEYIGYSFDTQKMGYTGFNWYYPNTYTMPMYHYAPHSQNYSDHGSTVAYSHSPSGGHVHPLFSFQEDQNETGNNQATNGTFSGPD